MTAEPIREPDDEEPKAPTPDAPAPDASNTTSSTTAEGGAAQTEVTASVETPAADTAAVDTATVDSAAVAAGAIEGGAVDAGAVDAGAVDAGAVEAVPETPVVAAEAPAVPAKPSRRPVILTWIRRLVTFAIAIALFVSGVAIGSTTFQRTRPAPLGTDGSIPTSQAPPAVALEFIAALNANDADAMRSSLNAQPNKDLTDEFARFEIKKVVGVETLGTSVDGNRSATEILLKTEKTDGLPFEVNLVILVDGNQIEGFR
jgi:hypothetical protein